MTSSVKECARHARSTHFVHHAIVRSVNIVIGDVLGQVLFARQVPKVVDAAFTVSHVSRQG